MYIKGYFCFDKDLRKALRNGSQKQIVRAIFKRINQEALSSWDVFHYVNKYKNMPLKSVKRAIADLKNDGIILKTDSVKISEFEKENFTYVLTCDFEKHRHLFIQGKQK